MAGFMATFSPSGGPEAGATLCSCESTGWTAGAGWEERAAARSMLLGADDDVVGVTGLVG